MSSVHMDVFHSRSVSPTRRVAIRDTNFSFCDLAECFPGLISLWVDVVSRLGVEERAVLKRTVNEVVEGNVPSSRLRHRIQYDYTGLQKTVLCVESDGSYQIDGYINSQQVVLGVVMLLRNFLPDTEPMLKLMGGLCEVNTHSFWGSNNLDFVRVVWAKRVLGVNVDSFSREFVMKQFREKVRLSHPDTGNEHNVSVRDLMEARNVLFGVLTAQC